MTRSKTFYVIIYMGKGLNSHIYRKVYAWRKTYRLFNSYNLISMPLTEYGPLCTQYTQKPKHDLTTSQ